MLIKEWVAPEADHALFGDHELVIHPLKKAN